MGGVNSSSTLCKMLLQLALYRLEKDPAMRIKLLWENIKQWNPVNKVTNAGGPWKFGLTCTNGVKILKFGFVVIRLTGNEYVWEAKIWKV